MTGTSVAVYDECRNQVGILPPTAVFQGRRVVEEGAAPVWLVEKTKDGAWPFKAFEPRLGWAMGPMGPLGSITSQARLVLIGPRPGLAGRAPSQA